MKPIRIMFGLVALAALLSNPLLAAEPSAPKPNIVILYGDDVGYGDLGCYGATAVKTPNVDRLASEGLRFTSAYCSSATCTPSRFSLLTGEYAFRQKGTGVLPGDARLIIQPARPTLASILQQAGYKTGIVGKWHLGLGSGKIDWNGEVKPGPCEVGFDYSFIMAATADRVPCVYIEGHNVVGLTPGDPIEVSYKTPFPGEPLASTSSEPLKMTAEPNHSQALVNGIGRIGYMKGGNSALWKDEEMADLYTRHALEFIDREKARPFFLYLATTDIHVPRVPNPRFTGKTTMGPRGDAIVEFDDCVGAVLKKLDELKLSDHTLVILSSDNGPVIRDGYNDGAVEKLGDHKPAGPFSGGKYKLLEGGTRVPFIVRWPRRVKPGVSDAIVGQVDLCASMAALVGQHPAIATMSDSMNVMPALLGDAKTARADIVEYNGRLALRQGDWKLMPKAETFPARKRGAAQDDGTFALFNLATDPGETKDVAAEHPEVVQTMRDRLEKIRGAKAEQARGTNPE